jgi:tRNA (cytidine/uridine-2'-O-)-methyltransferase
MFDIVLFQPEIPQNTGNIMRLAANCGCRLHLVHPLGFTLSDRQVKRAGMDYRDLAVVSEHASWSDCVAQFSSERLFAFTTKASRPFTSVNYQAGDAFIFGPETRGLPDNILEALPPEQQLRIPMTPHSRSLNLANAVSVVVFEAWRQQSFAGAAERDDWR